MTCFIRESTNGVVLKARGEEQHLKASSMMLHIHAREDDKQGYENTAERVCLTLDSSLTPPLLLTTLSGPRTIIWKTLKTFLCAHDVFCRAVPSRFSALWPFRPLAQIKMDDSSAPRAAEVLRPRRRPLPSCPDKIVCGWSRSGGRTIYQDLSIRPSTQTWIEPSCGFWCLTFFFFFGCPSIRFLLTTTY